MNGAYSRWFWLAALVAFLFGGCGGNTGINPAPAPDAGRPGADAGTDAPLAAGDAGDAAIADGGPITLDLEPGCNPFATSSECLLPYPSGFFQKADPTSPTGVRNDFPAGIFGAADEGSAHPIPVDVAPYNLADGASPAAPILLHFGFDIDLGNLPDLHHVAASVEATSPVAIFDEDTGERMPFFAEMDENRKKAYPGRYAFIIRPAQPLAMGDRVVVVLTDQVTDTNGKPIASPPAFAALRDGVATTNAEIEDVRPHYEQMFQFLDRHGYARSKLALAWDFMVASRDFVLGSVESMRATALNMLAGGSLPYTITSVQDDPNSNLAKIVEGDFQVPTFLNANKTFDYDAQHHPQLQATNQSYPFTMLIPMKALDGQPLPLVVFGHGLFGTGRDYLAGSLGGAIQPIAQEAGIVMIGTDWVGLSGSDAALVPAVVAPNVNNVNIVTDQLQQSLINNLAMTVLAKDGLENDASVQVGANPLIDPGRIYYFGVSLGGIQGGSFVSISPDISRAVLNVPGAAWASMISRSVDWPPIKSVLDQHYPDPLTQQVGIALIQTRFDHTDPANLGKLMFDSDAPPNRIVLLQESIGDCQVPNITTEFLARALGVKVMTPSITDVFGLDPVTSPTEQSALEQFKLSSLTAAYMPPDTNVPPSEDNGVHSATAIQPEALQQIEWLVTNGEIKSFCSGACVLP
jgi:hypothetical protein